MLEKRIEVEEVEVEKVENADIRGTREDKERKAGGNNLLDVFSSLDIRCFNRHEKERAERKALTENFKKEDWAQLNDWIFGLSTYNPMYPETQQENKEGNL